MNSRKKLPLARNTVNHLARFEETAASVERVGELPADEKDSADQKNFPDAIKTDILKTYAKRMQPKHIFNVGHCFVTKRYLH